MSKLIRVSVGLALVAILAGAGVVALAFEKDFSFGGKMDFDISLGAAVTIEANVKLNDTRVGSDFRFDSNADGNRDPVWEMQELDLSSASDTVTYTVKVTNSGDLPVVARVTREQTGSGFMLSYIGSGQEVGKDVQAVIPSGESFTFVYRLSVTATKRGTYESYVDFSAKITAEDLG